MASKTNVSDYRFSIFINNDQAKQSLIEMEKVMMGYEQELKNLEKEGKKNTEEYRIRKESIDQLNAKMVEARKEAGLQALSLKELKSLQGVLRNEMARAVPGTEHWKKLEAELAQVNARYRELTVSSKSTGISLGGMADGFNKYFGILTAGIASLTGLIFSFRKVIDTFNEFEKKLDNLSALTGLVGKDLTWLSDQAKMMSTSMIEGNVRITQSADSIVDAYTKVGSARPELLKNKEDLNMVTKEAIILSEAANTELQPAVTALTGVLNQFNAPASDSRRIINALAAGSKEGAGEIPYLTEAIEKSGTVAADAGLSYEQLVGTLETLAPRMTQPEMAGRSLRAVLLKLQEGANDTNPAIVGMEKAFENLAKKHISVTELVKMFGVENITAAKILINNVGELKKYTQAVTDTSVALEQASINTDNNSSRLEQAKNKVQLMSIELGEKLAPALTFSTNAFSYLMKAILGTIKFVNEHKEAVLAAMAAVAGYTVAVYGAIAVEKAYAAVTWLLDAAQKALNTTMKANPWGFIIAGVSAVITYFVALNKSTETLIESQNELNKIKDDGIKRTNEETAAAKSWLEQLKKSNAGSEERKALIQKINETYGVHLENLSNEKDFLKQIDGSYKNIIDSIKEKIILDTRQKTLTELIRQQDAGTEFRKQDIRARESQLSIPGIDKAKVIKDIEEAKKNLETFIKEYDNKIQAVFDEASGKLAPFIKIKDKDNGGGSPPADAVAYAKKIQQAIEDARIQIIREERKRELALNDLNLKRQLESIKGYSKEEVELRALYQQQARDKEVDINKKYDEKELQDNFKLEKGVWEAKISAALKGSEDWYKLSIEWINKQQDYELQNTELTEEQKLEIIKKFASLRAEIEKNAGFIGPVIPKKEKSSEKEKDDMMQKSGAADIDAINISQRIKLLKIQRDLDLESAKESAEGQKKIWDDYYANQLGVIIEFSDRVSNVAQQVVSSLAGVNQAMSDYENSQLKKDEDSNNQKKINLKKQLDAKLISQKQYDAGVEKLDKELDAKKKQLAHDQAKRQKALSLAQAIINTAQAITSALATSGSPILGIIMAALVGILGAIQIGYIASTPIPEAMRGRYKAIVRQAASGRYDVLGEEDMKMYRGVPLVKSPKSGEYMKPTLFAETGSEIILNPVHTRNLKEKRPDLLRELMDVPQRAGGLYPVLPEDPGVVIPQMDITINPKSLENLRSFRTDVIESFTRGPQYSWSNQNNYYSQAPKEIPIKFDPEFTEAIKDHTQALRKPTPQKSYIVYTELNEMNRQAASIEADVTK